jgi:hypothetical protein
MRLVLCSLVLVCGCPKKDVVSAAPAEPSCTLDTPLVPGVPGSPGHLIASERNPNGASELATHMRMMVEDVKAARARLEKGEPLPPLRAKHAKLRCAWPTDPSDRNQAFDAMAQTYLAAVAALDEKPADPKQAYTNVVKACRSCHEATCDGPIAVIDQLALESK